MPVTPPSRRRVRRGLACGLTIAGVLVTTAGTSRAEPYAAPGPLPAITAGTLPARYAAEHRAIAAARGTARRVGDRARAAALDAFLRPGRRFLSFDPRGGGQAAETLGDLTTARRVAVLVPGADTTLGAFDARPGRPWATPGGGARALSAQADRDGSGRGLAVVAWLGYAAPRMLSGGVLTDVRAGQGAVELRRFLAALHRVNPAADVALLCHSYGSVVCGRAARGPGFAAGSRVSDVALYGSPGTTAWSAAAFGPARVWAGRGRTDWMEDVPHVRFLGVGLGRDPVSPAFGARSFAAGPGGHSDYLRPGSPSLRNLTAIATGHPIAVTPASRRH